LAAVVSLSSVVVHASTSGAKAVDVAARAEGMLIEIQKHGGKATPGVREEIQQQVDQLNSLVPLIRAGHQRTQDALDDGINRLQTTTSTAQMGRDKANVADSEWYTCVMNERDTLAEQEAAVIARNDAKTRMLEACQRAKDTMRSSHTLPAFLASFECNMAMDKAACTRAFAQRNATFRSELEALVARVNADVEVWVANNNNCSFTAKALTMAMKEVTRLEQAVAAKRSECQERNTTRFAAFCDFAAAYQGKCQAKSDYTNLLAAVAQVNGDDLSNPDREQEFTTVMTARCHLTNFLNSNEASCTGFDFSESVGVLDKHEEDVSALTAFTCAETEFTFGSGQTWVLPATESLQSSDYETTSFAVPVSDGGFAFCSA